MGAATDVTPAAGPWASALALWTGILAGPVAWAVDLSLSYALVKWTCIARRQDVLHVITFAALTAVALGAVISWRALQRTEHPTDGGRPPQRARFMAILGLSTCALFALTIVAGAIPVWVLDACQ